MYRYACFDRYSRHRAHVDISAVAEILVNMADPPPRQSPTRSPSILSLLNPAPANEPFFGGKKSPVTASPPAPALPTPPIPTSTPGTDGPTVPRSNSIHFLTGSPAGGATSASARAFGKRSADEAYQDGRAEGLVNGNGAKGSHSEPMSRDRSSPGSATANDLSEPGSAVPRKRPRTSGGGPLGTTGSPASHHSPMPPPARAASAYPPSTNGQYRVSLGTPGAGAPAPSRGSHSPSNSVSGPLPSPGTTERPLSGVSANAAPFVSPQIVTTPGASGPSNSYFAGLTRSPNREGSIPLPVTGPRRASVADDRTPSAPSGPSSRPSTSVAPPPPPHHKTPPNGLDLLEPSIFGIPPLDEFTVEVGAWIWAWVEHIWSQGDGRMIEIEAKIGILRNTKTAGPRQQASRLSMPIAVETILTDSTDIRFESNMTEKQHKRYNQILNARVEESAAKAYRGAPIKYSHRYETDEFYSADGQPSGPGRGKKVRVTRDQKTGQIPENGVITKERVADMNVFSPKRAFDFRISINIERPSASRTPRRSWLRRADVLSKPQLNNREGHPHTEDSRTVSRIVIKCATST